MTTTQRTHVRVIRRLAIAASMLTAAGGVALAETAAPQAIADKGKIVYCTDISFPPLEFYDPVTTEPTGFDVDLGKAIAAELGVEAEYSNISFDGLIPALQAGQCDAIISGLFDKPARREVVDFVNYAHIGNSLIVKEGSSLYFNSLEELAGQKVAVESGSTLEEEVLAASAAAASAGKPEIKVVSLPKATDAFQQLIAGLVDVYYGSTMQEAYFNSQNPGQVKLASPQTSAFYIGIATVKGNAELHKAFDAALKAVQANGEYDRIVAKWSFESMAYKP